MVFLATSPPLVWIRSSSETCAFDAGRAAWPSMTEGGRQEGEGEALTREGEAEASWGRRRRGGEEAEGIGEKEEAKREEGGGHSSRAGGGGGQEEEGGKEGEEEGDGQARRGGGRRSKKRGRWRRRTRG